MSELLRNVDGRTRLAGTNKLELLLFTLRADDSTGRRELFGVNVFKVREVMRTPAITRAPDMPTGVEGMVSLRGSLVPVVDLVRYVAGAQDSAPSGAGGATPPPIMIVTELNGQTQGLLVEAVDTILRVEWSAMRAPPRLIAGRAAGLVPAVTELEDGRLVMMLDVEQLLAQVDPDAGQTVGDHAACTVPSGRTVLFADDSAVARREIGRTLDALAVRHIATANGAEAWRELSRLADRARARGGDVREEVQLVLTDIEMPEMDGYTLTKRIKSDVRLKHLPVIIHSSLPGNCGQQLGRAVGVDEYVSKCEPGRLAEAITSRLA